MTNHLRSAVEAAVWAPSLHNSQPWSFVIEGDEIRVRADPERWSRAGDPEGREQLISCGAALFTIRTALRAAGLRPVVTVLPDPDRPAVLASVRADGPMDADEQVKLMNEQIPARRTHRAGFADEPVPQDLVTALVKQAEAEGAHLLLVEQDAAVRALAAITAAAQEIQAGDRAFTLESVKWGRPPGSRHGDGVPAAAYPRDPRRTSPHFAQRDYAHGNAWGTGEDRGDETATGLVAMITTRADDRRDWIAAGQALQRVLLHAAANGVRAAFHTQALERPLLRAFIREELCAGEHPQMILRLGHTGTETHGVRRPVHEVLDEK
ncbi:nitroreductase family protein [Sphaerisporangium rubeum]|uniref:Nitroreductase n=1 Tax=Sphaerisporangium rubeum TaxID=321317 RepID=A0A7X0M5G8_9ACTN|nr:nitroreductase family protein [Sphaerisporangium rubeum]MBB6470811.1 nitroreductase [Sphaerisporangium rubeum]